MDCMMFSWSACRFSSAPLVCFSCTSTWRNFADQQASQVGDREIGKQVDENDDLQVAIRDGSSGIGRNHVEIGQFENGSIQDESQRRGQICPGPRQQHAGHNDDQRIEEVQRAIDAAGDIDHQRDHDQVGEHLQKGLKRCSSRPKAEDEEKRKHEPQQHAWKEQAKGSGARSEPDDGQFDAEQEQSG